MQIKSSKPFKTWATRLSLKTSRLLDSANDVNHSYKVSLSIEGMTCGFCGGTITRGLQDLSDVQEVNVDLVGSSATVEISNCSTTDSILTKIEDLGYGATVADINELYPKDKGARLTNAAYSYKYLECTGQIAPSTLSVLYTRLSVMTSSSRSIEALKNLESLLFTDRSSDSTVYLRPNL